MYLRKRLAVSGFITYSKPTCLIRQHTQWGKYLSMTYEGLTHEEACAMQLPQHVPVNPRDTRIAELERKIFQLESPHCQRLRLASCCTGIIIIAWLVCYVSYRIFPDVAYHILSWAIIHILWIILNTTCDADWRLTWTQCMRYVRSYLWWFSVAWRGSGGWRRRGQCVEWACLEQDDSIYGK
jgi:hypothetical protein